MRTRAFPIFACVSLCLVLCLGGGTRPGLLSDVITQIVAIPLLFWSCWKLWQSETGSSPRFAFVLIALSALFPLAQLVPLRFPGSAAGLGRQLQDEVLALVGYAPSSTVTVATDVTILSILSLLPAIAVFIATLALPQRQRRWLAFVVIGFAFVSVLLGLLQLSQGKDSALRFYAITNREDAVGFFANRNHFSALLNCTIVLTSAWLVFIASDAGLKSGLGPWRHVLLIAGVTLVVSLLAAQAMARSRAGVGLALVAVGLSYALMPGLVRPRDARTNPLRALAVTIGLGAILAIQYGTSRMVERFAADPLQDARKMFARNTYEAILAYLPFGSGLGTFTQVYPSFEALETALISTYVNRAHSDVIEYVLELGIVAVILMGLGIIYLATRAIPLWRSSRPVTLDLMLQRASVFVLVLIFLHSVVDYPLRTGAMLALFAVSAGLLLSTWGDAPGEPEAGLRSSRQGQERAPRHAEDTRPSLADTASEPRDSTPVRRVAWGQDIAWPDAWRTDKRSAKDK